ncbi:MAG TPA: hypothetical protein VHZ97_23345 [Pseudonocardiaceae bacterium]|nr:hypothetical protein [Pseudonocardiaceae bacterium]
MPQDRAEAAAAEHGRTDGGEHVAGVVLLDAFEPHISLRAW